MSFVDKAILSKSSGNWFIYVGAILINICLLIYTQRLDLINSKIFNFKYIILVTSTSKQLSYHDNNLQMKRECFLERLTYENFEILNVSRYSFRSLVLVGVRGEG